MQMAASRDWAWQVLAAVVAALVAAVPGIALARQLQVLEVRPAADAEIRGRHAEYVVRFNGQVDHAASRLQITQAGRVVQVLIPRMDSAVDVLFAGGEAPPPGRYMLHWEARSLDGDVSTGGSSFVVTP
jgi:methionine-rich copper-binding protein CopC